MSAAPYLITDPVCGVKIRLSKAELCYHLNGKMYYFCSAACYLLFVQDPGHYIPQRKELEQSF